LLQFFVSPKIGTATGAIRLFPLLTSQERSFAKASQVRAPEPEDDDEARHNRERHADR
jgi:hypothetical protein